MFPEEGTLYAQVDNPITIQDYVPRQFCVRLIGVTPASFNGELFNLSEGCETYVIDVGWSDVDAHTACSSWIHRLSRQNRWARSYGYSLSEDASSNIWWKIDYQVSRAATNSYAYAAFANDEPKYLEIKSIKAIPRGPLVKSIQPGAIPVITQNQPGAATLTAYHVGQGMCSLMALGTTGYLLDAGAGTPVSREFYRAGVHANGNPFNNQLAIDLGKLETFSAIISHPDSDHWRILDWDAQILKNVQTVYLPAGQPALAFSAPNIKSKVVGMADGNFVMGASSGLNVFRSSPIVSDKNGECLVVRAYSQEAVALLPGDYVYDRMATDIRPDGALASLATADFDAVVVPHHGDKASASVLCWPKGPDRSIAFFSAGTHAGYGHPTPESLSAHSSRGFRVVDKHWSTDITAQQLLP